MQRAKMVLGLILALLFTPIIRESAAAPQRDDWQDSEKLDNTFKVRTDRDFRLRLDVDAGEVRMSRGQSEDELRVHLVYSKKEFRHAFRFNEQDNFLEIRFDKEGWFDHKKDRLKAELEIELPRDATMRADCKIKAGEVDMQLGGLRLADFAMSVTAGSVNIDFDQPNRVEMESLTLNTKIGESKFRRLGNARFRDADLNGGIGEMTIDFSGAMLAEAVARVDLDIGETVIVLPQDTATKLAVSKFLFLSQVDLPFSLHKEGRYYYTEDYRDADRGFQLRVSSGIGELRVERP
jgi:hypothetical protein